MLRIGRFVVYESLMPFTTTAKRNLPKANFPFRAFKKGYIQNTIQGFG